MTKSEIFFSSSKLILFDILLIKNHSLAFQTNWQNFQVQKGGKNLISHVKIFRVCMKRKNIQKYFFISRFLMS